MPRRKKSVTQNNNANTTATLNPEVIKLLAYYGGLKSEDPTNIAEVVKKLRERFSNEISLGPKVAVVGDKTAASGTSFLREAMEELKKTSPNIYEELSKKYGAMGDAGADVSFYPPRWFSPMLSWVHFYMPTDLKTTLTWIRHWDMFHPLVGNSIDLHTALTVGKFMMRTRDPYVRRFYEDMWETLGGILFLTGMVREYYLTGGFYAFLLFDDEDGIFYRALPLPPEDIVISKSGIAHKYGDDVEYKLQLSQRTFNPEMNALDRQLLEVLPRDVLMSLKKGNEIPLPSQYLLVVQRKQSPYQLREASIVLRMMKDLLYEDKLREAQYAIAQRFINPKEIWRVGNDNFPATDDELVALKEALAQAEQNPLFTLITKHTVQAEYLFGGQGLSPMKEEFNWIEDRVLTGLFTNKAITHGEGPTYANASVAYKVMMLRYIEVRARIERALIDKIFLPIAVMHDFFDVTPAELAHHIKRPYIDRRPILPEFDWGGMRSPLIEYPNLGQIIRAFKEAGFPMKTIIEFIGSDLDWESVLQAKKEEEGTPFDPLYEKWREQTMSTLPSPYQTGAEGGAGLPAFGASFKLKLIDDNGNVKYADVKWPNKQNLLAKAEFARFLSSVEKKFGGIPQALFEVIVNNEKEGING